MGKYSGVVDKLPRLASEEPAYQEKINALKEVISSEPDFQRHASALARMYIDTRTGLAPESLNQEARESLIVALGKEGLQELLSECQMRLTAIEQMLVEQYEVEDTTSLRLDTGASVAVQLEPYAQVRDRETYRLWCIKEGFAPIMTVPWQTTNTETKRRLLAGEPPPPGVEAYAHPKIVLRRG